MGVPKQQATRNRQAIIDTAARVFRERGVDGVGVADLMKAAGFTHGGFYNHFESKDALAAEACTAAFASGVARLAELDAAGADPAGAARAFVEAYLSPEHCCEPDAGCPMATLAVDAARQGKEMQAAYARGFEAFLQAVAAHVAGDAACAAGTQEARAFAIDLLARLIGTILLARGVGQADAGLREEILAVGRRHPGP